MRRRSVAAACALVVALGALSLSTATAQDSDASRVSALDRFQMEQMLVHLRASGRAVAPPSIDAYVPRIKIPEVRALLERTNGKPLSPSTVALSDPLMEQAIVTMYGTLLGGGGGCCPCSSAASCNDGLFCDGAEICATGNCAPGPAPCVDGNPCTIDSCTENTDTCTFTPVPPPPAVARLDLSRGSPATVATLTWSAVTGASAYNIYRSAFSNLGGLACFQSGVTGTSQNDDGVRPANAFYFLVSSLACGESGLGDGSPTPRPPAPGCP